MKKSALVIFLAGAICSGQAAAQAIYSSAHQILVEAITTGKANGVVSGPLAEHFAKTFKSDGTLTVAATVLGKLDVKRTDCRRLEVIFTQSRVVTPQGMTKVHMNTKINYCLDGQYPADYGR